MFVEMAMNYAAGKGDYEVHRITCLQTAAMGYAPLIFDLAEDAGLEELLQQCGVVWNSLKAMDDLPQKLVNAENLITL